MKAATALLVAASLIACADDPFRPTVENVAGTYTVRTLTTTQAGITLDWVGRGATLTLTLAANGTTSGHLFAPGAGEAGEDVDLDLTGTWLLIGKGIQFEQTADTFLNDMTLNAEQNRLTGDYTFSDGLRLRIVLTK